MKAVHEDVRYLAVVNFLTHKNSNITCSIFKISRSTLYRFVYKFQNNISLKPNRKTQPTKFTEEHRQYIYDLGTQKRLMTTATMVKSFVRKFQISISRKTVCRILKQKGLVYKRVYSRNKIDNRRKRFHSQVQHIPIDRLLSVDEMGFGYGHIQRRRAWHFHNKQNKVYRRDNTFFRTNKTVVCMINSKGIINYEWSTKPMNTATFSEFLHKSLSPYAGYYIIMDNVSFHKSKLVRSVLNAYQVTPLYIDPYTPEQNPIEEVFSNIKSYVKSTCPYSHSLFDKRLKTAMLRQKKLTLMKCFRRSIELDT